MSGGYENWLVRLKRVLVARGPSALPVAVLMVCVAGCGFPSSGAAPTPTVPIPTFTPVLTATPESTPTAPVLTDTPQPTTTVGLSSTSGPKLYSTTFASGSNGWSTIGDGQWQTVSGILTYDGSGTSVFIGPTRTGSKQNFAVEARIQALGKPANNYSCGYFYGIFVRGDYKAGSPGDVGGFDAGLRSACNENSYWSVWTGLDAYNPDLVVRSNAKDDKAWHTYRIEVHGNQYTLYVDGNKMGTGLNNRFLSGTAVGLFALNDQIDVSSFQVQSL
jgi:hypothetical protein